MHFFGIFKAVGIGQYFQLSWLRYHHVIVMNFTLLYNEIFQNMHISISYQLTVSPMTSNSSFSLDITVVSLLELFKMATSPKLSPLFKNITVFWLPPSLVDTTPTTQKSFSHIINLSICIYMFNIPLYNFASIMGESLCIISPRSVTCWQLLFVLM